MRPGRSALRGGSRPCVDAMGAEKSVIPLRRTASSICSASNRQGQYWPIFGSGSPDILSHASKTFCSTLTGSLVYRRASWSPSPGRCRHTAFAPPDYAPARSIVAIASASATAAFDRLSLKCLNASATSRSSWTSSGTVALGSRRKRSIARCIYKGMGGRSRSSGGHIRTCRRGLCDQAQACDENDRTRDSCGCAIQAGS
jgi:hypothetical protein